MDAGVVITVIAFTVSTVITVSTVVHLARRLSRLEDHVYTNWEL